MSQANNRSKGFPKKNLSPAGFSITSCIAIFLLTNQSFHNPSRSGLSLNGPQIEDVGIHYDLQANLFFKKSVSDWKCRPNVFVL